MEYLPYVSTGPDGRPCIRFRLIPKPQPYQPQQFDWRQLLQDGTLVLGFLAAICSVKHCSSRRR